MILITTTNPQYLNHLPNNDNAECYNSSAGGIVVTLCIISKKQSKQILKIVSANLFETVGLQEIGIIS